MKPLKAKTKLYCPKCDLHIGEVLHDVLPGEVLKADAFQFASDVSMKDGDPMKCPMCETSFGLITAFTGMSLYTDKGWIS